METKDGANCKATVECDDGKKEYNPNGKPSHERIAHRTNTNTLKVPAGTSALLEEDSTSRTHALVTSASPSKKKTVPVRVKDSPHPSFSSSMSVIGKRSR